MWTSLCEWARVAALTCRITATESLTFLDTIQRSMRDRVEVGLRGPLKRRAGRN